LTKTFKRSEVIKASDDIEKLMQEREYLVPGVVTGAKVVKNNGWYQKSQRILKNVVTNCS